LEGDVNLRRLWWLIVGGLLLAANAWALYAVSFYLFLARAVPVREAESRG
jgi:hypothetical protein